MIADVEQVEGFREWHAECGGEFVDVDPVRGPPVLAAADLHGLDGDAESVAVLAEAGDVPVGGKAVGLLEERAEVYAATAVGDGVLDAADHEEPQPLLSRPHFSRIRANILLLLALHLVALPVVIVWGCGPVGGHDPQHHRSPEEGRSGGCQGLRQGGQVGAEEDPADDDGEGAEAELLQQVPAGALLLRLLLPTALLTGSRGCRARGLRLACALARVLLCGVRLLVRLLPGRALPLGLLLRLGAALTALLASGLLRRRALGERDQEAPGPADQHG
ncbi:hypothetical protein [Streptomyces sp. NPDC005302]|uniref:hypothetical protein n=1 Tax=Streptomyces sp. NPDC005302 TaxID=3154675 RepID=UPI0033A885EF